MQHAHNSSQSSSPFPASPSSLAPAAAAPAAAPPASFRGPASPTSSSEDAQASRAASLALCSSVRPVRSSRLRGSSRPCWSSRQAGVRA